MTIPPGEVDYPTMDCPQCNQKYDIRDLDLEDEADPPKYYCPNCGALVYVPKPE